MMTVCEINKCCGCMACTDICPKNAISFVDELKASNAVIDNDKCIKCNMCHKVCQYNHPAMFLTPVYWKQGWAKDVRIRNYSSSGGAANVFSQQFVKNGGVVCSCMFKNGAFVFDFAETVEQVQKFSGSKYIKSNPSGAYKKAKEILSSGKKLLFIGLPCQVSAMKNYTGNHESLYTIDLICHGTPSPEILNTYLKQSDKDINLFKNLYFRKNTHFQLTDREDDSFHAVFEDYITDAYLISFLNCLCYTENCYYCQYAKLERVSDITLGDSWGSELDQNEQKKGISLILCQTQKGVELVTKSDMVLHDVDLNTAVTHNHQLAAPSQKPVERDHFFELLNKGIKFEDIIKKIFPKQYLRQKIKRSLIKLHILRYK